MLDSVFASGVIEDAPSLAALLTRVLGFLLEVFGIIAILGVIAVGVRYLFVAENAKEIFRAKQALVGVVLGVVAVLAALVVVRQLANFL